MLFLFKDCMYWCLDEQVYFWWERTFAPSFLLGRSNNNEGITLTYNTAALKYYLYLLKIHWAKTIEARYINNKDTKSGL